MEALSLKATSGTPQKRAALKSNPLPGKHARQIGKHWTEEEIIQLADDLFDWYQSDGSLLWLGDFFTARMIAKSTLSRIRARNEYFKEVYGICKEIQEARLFKLGLAGTNVQTIIFALKNLCRWRSEPKDDEPEKIPVTVRFIPHRLADTDHNETNQNNQDNEQG